MTVYTYQRPREKLQQKGVSALTHAELLQVIIGSGSAGIPVTKIARTVDKVLQEKKESVLVSDLTAIPGLGAVKAGQIIAGLELASRLAYQKGEGLHRDIDVLTSLYSDIRSSKKTVLLYAFFDGNGRLIGDYSETINVKSNTARIARKLFGEALAHSTASVLVAIGGDSQSLEPTMFELSLARDVYSTAAMLSIAVKTFVLVSASGEYVIKKDNHG